MTSHCWEPIQLPNNAAGEWMERLGYYAEEAIPEAIQRGGRSPGSGIIVNKGGLKTPIGRWDDGSNPLLARSSLFCQYLASRSLHPASIQPISRWPLTCQYISL